MFGTLRYFYFRNDCCFTVGTMKISNRKSKISIEGPFWQVMALGALAGMRTFSAPVIANAILRKHPSQKLSGSPLRFLQSDKAKYGFRFLAAGELVGDKLPNAPNRTAAPGLVGRCLSGALAGAVTYKATGNKAYTGAIIGSFTALASSFGCFYLRRFAVAKSKLADPVIGGIEDALVAVAGAGLIIAA